MPAADKPGGLNNARMAATVLVGGQLIAAAGAVVVNLLAARVLDPAPRGDLAYALQMAYFFSVFAVLGLERPFMAARSGTFHGEYENFTRMITPGTLAVVPLIVLATAISPFSSDWMWYGAIAIVVYVALNSLVLAVRVAYVSSRDWRKFSINAIGSQIIIVFGAAVLYLSDVNDPVKWMAVYSLSAIPALVLLLSGLRDRNKPATLTRSERRILRRKGLILLPASFSNVAMQRSDRLLLPALGSPADLGLYVTVATVLEMATWPVERWVDASLRQWAQSSHLPLRVIWKTLFQSLLLLIALASLLGLGAYVMIVAFLPESYLPAIIVIVPLAISSVVYGLTRVQQGILIAFGAEAKVTGVELWGTAFSITSYVLLIPQFGMLGAAYGSIIGYSLCSVAAVFAMVSVIRRKKQNG